MPQTNECPQGDNFDWAHALLTHPRFVHLRRRAEEYALTWNEFKLMPQPPGVSPEHTWDLLTALRRQTAVELPDFGVGSRGHSGWYTLTRSMQADLANIDRRCHKGSWLDSVVQSKTITHFLAQAHVSDALTAVREDGVLLSRSRANELLFAERGPRTPEEHLLLNCHRMMWGLDEFADQRCTPELIMHLYERIADRAPEKTARPLGLEIGNLVPPMATRTQTLQVVSRLVNGDDIDESDHPVVVAMGLMYLMLNGCPLPSCNGVMASLLCRLLFLKTELPVAALIPILRLHRAWQDKTLRPPMVTTALADSVITVGGEQDFTIYHTNIVRLIRLELDSTEAALRRTIERDAVLSQALLAFSDINYRQRAVVNTALYNPDAEFRIDAHQRIHRVAYATARDDLLRLADLDLLDCTRRGRAFIFTPSPGLRRRLRNSLREAPRRTGDAGRGKRAGLGDPLRSGLD